MSDCDDEAVFLLSSYNMYLLTPSMEQHVPTMCVIVCQSGTFRLIDSMGSPWSLTAIERELKLGGKVENY